MIRVELTEEQLRAVVECVGQRENPDEETVLSRAEFALDLALLDHEKEADTAAWYAADCPPDA